MRCAWKRGGFACATALAGLAVASVAAAQDASAPAPSAADKATAEVLFVEGKTLLAQGKLTEACPKLAESLRLDTGLGTMLYLAECHERSGRTASAWAQFREAQAVASRDRDPREKIARARAEKLEPRLARLTVVVPPGADLPDLAVSRDGMPVGRPSWGTEVPVDPGKHVLRATANGRVAWETTLDVAEAGTRERVVVPPLAEVAPSPSPSPKLAPAAPPRPVETSPGKMSTQQLAALGVGALGVVGVGLGAFFGLRASGTLSDAEALCDARFCTAEGLALRDEARTQANVSTVAFAVGGLSLAGAAALWLTAPKARSAKGPSPRDPSLALWPAPARGGVTLGASGTF